MGDIFFSAIFRVRVRVICFDVYRISYKHVIKRNCALCFFYEKKN